MPPHCSLLNKTVAQQKKNGCALFVWWCGVPLWVNSGRRLQGAANCCLRGQPCAHPELRLRRKDWQASALCSLTFSSKGGVTADYRHQREGKEFTLVGPRPGSPRRMRVGSGRPAWLAGSRRSCPGSLEPHCRNRTSFAFECTGHQHLQRSIR